MVQTPTEELPVAGWQEEAGTWERGGRPDEGFQLFVRLADGMAKERDRCSIAGDTPPMLDDGRGALHDRIEQFTTTVMAVDLHTDLIAGVPITLGGWANSVSGNLYSEGAPCIVDSGSRATNPNLAYRASERL